MLRTNVFSPLTSRDKCVTDQNCHEHRTETPPTGIPHGEHILTSATHSALHYVVGNKIHPPGYLIVILPPRHNRLYTTFKRVLLISAPCLYKSHLGARHLFVSGQTYKISRGSNNAFPTVQIMCHYKSVLRSQCCARTSLF